MKRFKLFLLTACFLIASCTSDNDFEKGKKILEQQGFTEIEKTGYSAFCCSDDEHYSTGFKCKDSKGEIYKGCFCSRGITKGITIRWE